jgi:hypothetical protein
MMNFMNMKISCNDELPEYYSSDIPHSLCFYPFLMAGEKISFKKNYGPIF